MTLPPSEVLKKTHTPGLKGLFRVYNRKKLIKSLWAPTIVSIVAYFSIIFTQQGTFETIKSLISVILSVMPSTLGFVLGGYAIVIGFGNERFMKSTALVTEENPISFYQNFSSIFAFSILSLGTSLVLAFVLNLFSFVVTPPEVPTAFVKAANYLGLFVLMLSGTYSVFQIPVMILNIFSFSQTYHINMVSENEKERNKKRDGEIKQSDVK